MNIASKVSFLAGTQTTVDVKIGWTAIRAHTHFVIVLSNFIFTSKTNIK